MEKEKLTEKINSIKVSKSVKEAIIKIADEEQIQIQQVCRKILSKAIKKYLETRNKSDFLYYGGSMSTILSNTLFDLPEYFFYVNNIIF
jgi:hypothetical protein